MSTDMSSVRTHTPEILVGVFSSIVIGAGFVVLFGFAGFSSVFLIWMLGLAVSLVLIGILLGKTGDGSSSAAETSTPTERSGTNDEAVTDALATLRERYARGELTDDQFERKLDALLETDSPENAAEWRTRDRERVEERS